MVTCKRCKEFFSRFRCSAETWLECDCPRCQGTCECTSKEKRVPRPMLTEVPAWDSNWQSHN